MINFLMILLFMIIDDHIYDKNEYYLIVVCEFMRKIGFVICWDRFDLEEDDIALEDLEKKKCDNDWCKK